MSGGLTGLPCSWGEINTGTWPSGLGQSQIEIIKYSPESRGTQNRERLRRRRPAVTENYRHLSSERAPHVSKSVSQKIIKQTRRKISCGSQMGEVVGLERDPFSLLSTIVEPLGRKTSCSGLEIGNTAVGTRHADHFALSTRKRCH
jgi:hypothetical protein